MPTNSDAQGGKPDFVAPPAINLPKGGGAIRGIGEKFQANPVTGSGSFSVPLPVSPGRGGFQPELALSYDSGAGNGRFGLGWNVSVPAITRKTDKELPRYLDSSESDTFLLAGAEDLVPRREGSGDRISRAVTVSEGGGPVSYEVFPYRPRIEGLFARIEKWVNAETGLAHWRVTTKDNLTSIYGKSEGSRIVDPADRSRVFEWRIETTYDAKGNRIVYEYKQENAENIPARLSEQQRVINGTGFANRYLKRVHYSPVTGRAGRFHFQLVFDYGEHTADTPAETAPWPARLDPFSVCKAGFEVRTYRLCRRVLMFHNFPGQGDDTWELVKSLDLTYRQTAALAYLTSVTLTGFQKGATGYEAKSMPALEFKYTEPLPEALLRHVDRESLANLPAGLDEGAYQWADLAGEGSPGILSRHAGTIYYKENIGNAKFGAMRPVRTPVALAQDALLQIADVDGDGVNELVVRDDVISGYYRYASDHWEPFTAFRKNPVIDWSDPNLKMLDLSGDGHADVVITEDKLLRWYPSAGAEGFEPSRTAPVSGDERKGPKVLFSDPTQSIYLADMSGDGLTDIVRIRNGEVCYWPNLGHGRFGAKVAMASAPVFSEARDRFNPHYIKLGDIDGSGTTDILYLGNGAPKYYRNQAGNSWGAATEVHGFPPVDSLSSVSMVDLEGKGTMCLVWSTQIPGRREMQMSYLDLMGTKPHLLHEVDNNLGSVVRLAYAPSTRFYLEDKRNGKPWISRLSFPVHCLERVETEDRISGSRFVTLYRYHHGYFDGPEREFRGFGMVEQMDTEEFAAAGEPAGATNLAAAYYVPPVLTKTWFHTGMYLGRNHVSDFFAGLLDEHDRGEYYREPGLTDAEARLHLLPDTVMPPGLAPEEEREACRALKGAMLRREVYALDGSDKAGIPYTIAEQNFTIRCLQRRGDNRYAVFFTHPREAITCHYERNPVDPRIQHALTLEVDNYGNVLKSLAIGYGRERSPLPEQRDQEKQTTTRITYTESAVTNAIDDVLQYPDHYRTPLPAETRTYELTGFAPENEARRFSFDEWSRNGFAMPASAAEIPYEQAADHVARQKRLIEQVRTLYRKDDLTALLPRGRVQPMALPGETCKLAFTPGLLAQVFRRRRADGTDEDLLPDPAPLLEGKGADQGGYAFMDGKWWIPAGRSFYDPDADIADPARTAAQELSTARAHFYLPRKIADPFGQSSIVDYDGYDLLVRRTIDAVGNTVVADNDYRVLQPWRVSDPNRNRTVVAFDAIGMVVATAVMGKDGENLGDLPEGFTANPSLADLQAFIADPPAQAAALLGKATSRIVYDLERYRRAGQPPFAATLARETHVHDPGGDQTRIQVSFSYSDGLGREIQKKIQAEPGMAPQRQPPVSLPTGDVRPGELLRDAQGKPVPASTPQRWVGSGRTVFNNKGKPVRQYEPFFSATHLYEPEREMTDTGVSPVLFYDPVERVVATLRPDHSYEKVVFDPWQQATYDVNDTVAAHGTQSGDPRTDPDIRGYVDEYFKTQPNSWQTWYARRINNQLGAAERDAARKAAAHADTPTVAHLDALGRTFMTVAHNRYERGGVVVEEKNATRVEMDIEGNQRAVRDAIAQSGDPQGRIVMRYGYDMLGNRMHQLSMEAGARWMLNDVTGKPIRSWDSRGHVVRMEYDPLRRALRTFVTGADVGRPNDELLTERVVYGEQHPQDEQRNLRGRVYLHLDQAGVVTNEGHDFKGNLLSASRRLAGEYKKAIDWSAVNAIMPTNATAKLNQAALEAVLVPRLEAETFTSHTTYDALNRPVTATAPDGSIYRPGFNEANLLEKVNVNLRGVAAATPFVINIDYDAKGQRKLIEYGSGATGNPHGVTTTYDYDPFTFRLIRMTTTRPVNLNGLAAQLFKDPATVQDLRYTYDPAGNITHIADDALLTIHHNNEQVEPLCKYTYDALYRLIEARGREHIGQAVSMPNPPNGNFRDYPFVGTNQLGNPQELRNYTEQYVYDAVGNFQSMGHQAANGSWMRAYTYDEVSLIEANKYSNRLSKAPLQSDPPSVSKDFGYDPHGNMTRMPHLPLMRWDYRDQLLATAQQVVVDGIPETTWYVYDAAGQRVRKLTESMVSGQDVAAGKNPVRMKERIYLGGFEIYREYQNDGVTGRLERETLHVMDDKQRIALTETMTIDNGARVNMSIPSLRYQFGNHLGSASLELDDTGALISYEEYRPYGTSVFQAGRSAAETSLKRYRYTGKERDEENGLYYHGARYYAPWLGRWNSPDPAGLSDGLNAFCYVASNPVIARDPDGRQAVWDPESPKHGGAPDKPTEGQPGYTEPSNSISPGARLYDYLKAAGESVVQAGRNVGRSVSEAAAKGGEAIQHYGHKALEAGGKAVEAGRKAFEAAKEKVYEPIRPAVETIATLVGAKSGSVGKQVLGYVKSVGGGSVVQGARTMARAAKNAAAEGVEVMRGYGRQGVEAGTKAVATVRDAANAAGAAVASGARQTVEAGARAAAAVRSIASSAGAAVASGARQALAAGTSAFASVKGAAGTASTAVKGLAIATGGAVSSGAASVGGLLTSSMGTIAAGGAATVAAATGLVALAGAAGYGIGTVLNKVAVEPLLDKFSPGSGALGDWYYNTFLK